MYDKKRSCMITIKKDLKVINLVEKWKLTMFFCEFWDPLKQLVNDNFFLLPDKPQTCSDTCEITYSAWQDSWCIIFYLLIWHLFQNFSEHIRLICWYRVCWLQQGRKYFDLGKILATSNYFWRIHGENGW